MTVSSTFLPRLVGAGNYSRVGIARVRFDEKGDPAGIERLGIALEPEADYELRAGGGGCEDPRVTFVEGIRRYVMTYTALSDRGPRIAIATSEDLLRWERIGLAAFMPHGHVEFQGVDNKDGAIFPVPIPNPNGQPSVGLLHRPLFPGTRPEEIGERVYPETRADRIEHAPVDTERESIWISYCALGHAADPSHAHRAICHFGSHHRLASPRRRLGAREDRNGSAADFDPLRMAGRLPRRLRAPRANGGASLSLFRGGDGAVARAPPRTSCIARPSRCSRLPRPTSSAAPCRTSCSRRASIAATTSVSRTASTCITAWRTTASGWPSWSFRASSRHTRPRPEIPSPSVEQVHRERGEPRARRADHDGDQREPPATLARRTEREQRHEEPRSRAEDRAVEHEAELLETLPTAPEERRPEQPARAETDDETADDEALEAEELDEEGKQFGRQAR